MGAWGQAPEGGRAPWERVVQESLLTQACSPQDILDWEMTFFQTGYGSWRKENKLTFKLPVFLGKRIERVEDEKYQV